MGQEDDVKDLIGRMVGAQRQGLHVTPAMITVTLAALRFYLAGRAWLAKPRSDPHDDAPLHRPEPYTGPPATIADLRRYGLVACTIACAGANCWNTKRVLLDDLSLGDATPVPDIARRRGFRCRQCGSRQVRVVPDWTDHLTH